MRNGIIDLLNHGVNEESICLYESAMHDCIQDQLSSNNRNTDIDYDIDMQCDDCVSSRECKCVAM